MLSELVSLLQDFLPVQTSPYMCDMPDECVILTPLSDVLVHYCDNSPSYENQSVRISLFTKDNYLGIKDEIVSVLLENEFAISNMVYVGYEQDSKFHHYSIDVNKMKGRHYGHNRFR